MKKNEIEIFKPDSFDQENHFYPKALNAQIHRLVHFFLHLSHERIIKRYCYLNPMVQEKTLWEILTYRPKYFFWGGCDLFYVVTANGTRKMVVIETNSCVPRGKSLCR